MGFTFRNELNEVKLLNINMKENKFMWEGWWQE